MIKLIESKEDLARLLIAVADNRGETVDRYSLCFTDGNVLGMSDFPSHPQGFSQWSSFDPTYVGRCDEADQLSLLTDLPEHIVEHAIFRVNEGMSDWLEEQIAAGRSREDVIDELDEKRFDLCGPEYHREVL